MAEIRCTHCGWPNEPGARMCGGCGRPLYAGIAAGSSAAHAYTPVGDDEPTVSDLPPVVRTPVRRSSSGGAQRPTSLGRRASAPEWAPAPTWGARGSSTAGRIALIGLIVVLLAALAGVGAWAAIIRPQLHQRLDDALRAQLNGIVTTVNQQPIIPSTTVNITASQVTQSLQTQMPTGLPIQDLHVSFSGGRASVAFTTGGFEGAISTALTVHNGRLVASSTEVDGPLALVESGSDMEQALNAALGKLRTDVTVKQITLDKDTMSVAVKGNT